MVNYMIKEGWCEIIEDKKGLKNLIFSPNWKLAGKNSNDDWYKRITFNIEKFSKKEILDSLRLILIDIELKKQIYIRDIKRSPVKNRRGLNKLKLILQEHGEIVDKKVHLSLNSISKLLKVSKTAASYLVSLLKKKGLYRIKTYKASFVKKMTKDEYYQYSPFKKQGEFFYKGFLLLNKPKEFVRLSSSIFLK